MRAALQLLSAPLPPLCLSPAAAAVEAKALACAAEASFNGLRALAATWLGEHANSVAGEYAWKPWERKLGAVVAAHAAAAAAAAAEAEAEAAAAAGAPAGGAPPPGLGGGLVYGLGVGMNLRGQASAASGSAAGGPGALSVAPSMALGPAASLQAADSMGSAGVSAGGAGAARASGGPAGGVAGGDAGGCAALAVSGCEHNPLLAAIAAQLNRALLTGPPALRLPAAQALAKLAVRSGEPYRIQVRGREALPRHAASPLYQPPYVPHAQPTRLGLLHPPPPGVLHAVRGAGLRRGRPARPAGRGARAGPRTGGVGRHVRWRACAGARRGAARPQGQGLARARAGGAAAAARVAAGPAGGRRVRRAARAVPAAGAAQPPAALPRCDGAGGAGAGERLARRGGACT